MELLSSVMFYVLVAGSVLLVVACIIAFGNFVRVVRKEHRVLRTRVNDHFFTELLDERRANPNSLCSTNPF